MPFPLKIKLKIIVQNFRIKWILYVLFFSIHLFTKSQNSKIDSLKIALNTANTDTSRVNILNEIGGKLVRKEPDTAFKYLKLAEKISEKHLDIINVENTELKNDLRKLIQRKYARTSFLIANCFAKKREIEAAVPYFKKTLDLYTELNDQKNISLTYHNIGTIYLDLDEYEEALQWLKKGYEIRLKNGSKEEIGSSLAAMGLVYENTGKIKDALNVYEQNLKIYKELKNEYGLSATLMNIANVYHMQNHDSLALHTYEQSLSIRKKLNYKVGISACLNNIGTIFYAWAQYDKALEYFKESLKIKTELDDKYSMVILLRNISSIYSEIKQFKEAYEYGLRSLKIAKEIESKSALAEAYSSLSTTFSNQKKYREALFYAQQYFNLSQEMGNPQTIMYAANDLSVLNKKLGNYKAALELSELSIRMKDSLITEDNKKATYKSKLKYEYEKKALADSIKALDEKKVSMAQLAESNAKLKQEKTQRFALIGGLILLLTFSAVIFNRFKNSQRQKQIIESQKKIVDQSQQKIIASINYAKKIQYSILPSGEEIGKYFLQHFIFFKPKDIVSGDFYWFHHENDLSFIVTADCTGHGVPGAFMTMISLANLMEVVVEQKITSPDKILSALHNLIFKSLQQHKGDEYSQDGMDISLAIIDHQTNMLHFAGARNNGYLVDKEEIRTMKATPKSIGGLSVLGEVEPERSFKSEQFQLKKDTLVILSTDGFLDQLDPRDEKFGTDRFKEMLRHLYNNDFKDNLIFVENTFTNWQDKSTQIDDVLLIGLKL